MNEKILEEYYVKIYEIDPYFYVHCKKNLTKISANTYYFKIDVYFTEYFLAVEIDEQNHEGRELILEKNKTRGIKKKLGCKFIRINTSNAKKGYDTD